MATTLRESAARTPHAPVIKCSGHTMSYGELDGLSDRMARGLADAGLAPGAVVALQLPNVPEFAVACFGALKAGMTVLPLNPLLKSAETRYHLRDSGAAVLIGFEGFIDEAAADACAAGVGVYALAPSGAPLPDGTSAFETLLPDMPPGPDRGVHPTAADDTAVLVYTSGTTGRPKGAELAHFQMYLAVTVVGDAFGERPDDVSLAVLPFFHVFGLTALIRAVRFGSSVSVVPRFDVTAVLDAVEAHGVSEILGVPTMLLALAEADVGGRDLSRLRVAGSGGASLPAEVMDAFENKYGVPVLEGYGLTETAGICTFNTSAEDRRVLSVGRPVWGVEMAVLGPGGASLPPGPGNIGEIVTRGFNVMKGYRGRPDESAALLRDGWLSTGDVGYADEDGFYFVVDRSKDLIIRGGYNVYPREIEEVLLAHPAILEAAVIGRPDDRLGEEVVAVVVLREGGEPDEAAVIDHCRARMAAYKYPREVRFAPALPKGSTGKTLKTELRGGSSR
nr:long-chain fatty acid--CoA ligase [Streptomyces sp. HNM0575]